MTLMNRVARYVVVKFGDLTRGETMNVAVLAWDVQGGPDTPVRQGLLQDWSRVNRAFPHGALLRGDVVERLSKIKTFRDYQAVLERMGPYTPFAFTDERPSITSPEAILDYLTEFFIPEPTP